MSLLVLKTKLRWSISGFRLIFEELVRDLFTYYVSAYPILLILGAVRRFKRRMKSVWLPKSKGRPPVAEVVVDLILEMKRANWAWGGQRISDELKIMGIMVSKRTVLKILRENGLLPPKTRFTPPPWSAVIDAYREIWALDFTSIFDVRGHQLIVLNVINCVTRRLILSAVTANPDAAWLTQQVRNCAIINNGKLPGAMIRDNDAIFGKWFDPLLREFGITGIAIPYHSPWFNGHIERFHRSEKEEILYRIPIAGSAHAGKLCAHYTEFFNRLRPHQGINGQIPVTIGAGRPTTTVELAALRTKKTRILSGLVTHFELAA